MNRQGVSEKKPFNGVFWKYSLVYHIKLHLVRLNTWHSISTETRVLKYVHKSCEAQWWVTEGIINSSWGKSIDWLSGLRGGGTGGLVVRCSSHVWETWVWFLARSNFLLSH